MANEKELKQAKSIFDTICKMLDKNDLTYKKNEEKLIISCVIHGDDIPMDILFVVNPRAEVVSLISPMSFKMGEDKRVDGALAVCIANYGLVNGTFDYDINDGEIRFRMVSSYRESILSEELFMYMLMVSAHTVDEYNDKFLMLAKGMWGIEQFVEWENKKNAD